MVVIYSLIRKITHCLPIIRNRALIVSYCIVINNVEVIAFLLNDIEMNTEFIQ